MNSSPFTLSLKNSACGHARSGNISQAIEGFSKLTAPFRWLKLCLALCQRACSSMRWFRLNIHLGSWCALFAITIQLAVSFGHLHPQGIVPTHANSILVALFDDLSSTNAPDNPAAPAIPRKSQHRTASDFCAICSLIQLTGTMLPAATPPLPQTIVLGRALLGRGDQLALAHSHRGLWHARAPPLS